MSDDKNVEIERKFLLVSMPAYVAALPEVRIEQGFLNTDKHRVTRVRVTSEGEAFLTVKGLAHGATRVEIETPIDPQKARAMLSMVDGAVISKTRRRVANAGKIWEVDIFAGANEGLMVAEIELASEHESFDLPSWVGKEVTEDPRYANSSLALNPYSQWEPETAQIKASKP
jgi:adenylate cyclase